MLLNNLCVAPVARARRRRRAHSPRGKWPWRQRHRWPDSPKWPGSRTTQLDWCRTRIRFD